MKKTIVALLIAGSCAMASTESFASMSAATVAVTINVDALKALGANNASLFRLTGTWEDDAAGFLGVSKVGSGVQANWNKGSSTGNGNLSNAGMNTCFNGINLDAVVDMTMVITFNEGPANYENIANTPCMNYSTSISYLLTDGTVNTVAAEKNDLYRFTIKEGNTAVDMVNVFNATGIEVDDTYINSYNVSSGYLSFNDAKALSVSRLSIPEPTTATLSLLALAGLAARRRRK